MSEPFSAVWLAKARNRVMPTALVVGLEGAIGEPILTQTLPDVLDRVQLGRTRGQSDRREVGRHSQLELLEPTGAVENEDGVRAGGDLGGDLVEMELHHLGIGERHGQRCAFAANGADRAEAIGVRIALARPGSVPRPLPDQAVLQADARFVLEPDLDRRPFGQIGETDVQDFGEVSFESRDDPLVLLGMARAGSDVGEAERLEKLADAALVIGDAETPRDHPFRSMRRQRTTPSVLGSGPVSTISANSTNCAAGQPRLRPFAAMILQTYRPFGVETMNPIAQHLAVHADRLRRLGPILPLKHRRQRQQSPALVGVLRSLSEPWQLRHRLVLPKLRRSRHGHLPCPPLNQRSSDSGI